MLVKEQHQRASSTELTSILEKFEEMTEMAEITDKVN